MINLGVSTYAGGIVGNSSSNILVEGCYNSGDIEGVEGEAVGPVEEFQHLDGG